MEANACAEYRVVIVVFFYIPYLKVGNSPIYPLEDMLGIRERENE